MRLPTILGAIRVNPTGKGVRGCDGQGCGHFGARREGSRTHLGADYLAEAGQDVRAVATGQVAKIGWPYADDTSFRLVDIDALDGSRIREFYVSPGLGVEEGAFVFAGQVIGTQQPLGGRYSGITEHVHAVIWENGKPVDPEKRIGGGN